MKKLFQLSLKQFLYPVKEVFPVVVFTVSRRGVEFPQQVFLLVGQPFRYFDFNSQDQVAFAASAKLLDTVPLDPEFCSRLRSFRNPVFDRSA